MCTSQLQSNMLSAMISFLPADPHRVPCIKQEASQPHPRDTFSGKVGLASLRDVENFWPLISVLDSCFLLSTVWGWTEEDDALPGCPPGLRPEKGSHQRPMEESGRAHGPSLLLTD